MTSRSTILNMICLLIFLDMNPAQSATELLNSFSPCNSCIGQDQSPSRREYRSREAARGVTKDGIEASFQTYESSDGIRVFIRTEFFRSTDDMKTHFETQTKSFAEIIEKGDIKAVKGNPKKERIVGKHFPNEEGIEMYSIMWHEHGRIKYVESTSLDHALDFEKQFYKSQK